MDSVSRLCKLAFCPKIAIITTSAAAKITEKNYLSFSQLVQPFSQSLKDVVVKDLSNNPTVLKDLCLCFRDISYSAPTPNLFWPKLNKTVLAFKENVRLESISVPQSNSNCNVYYETPWFDAFCDQYYDMLPCDEHEFFDHYVACVFVVASNEANPIAQFHRLILQQQSIQGGGSGEGGVGRFSKWFCEETFRYFVLLHDESSGDVDGLDMFMGELQRLYSTQSCHLLRINSRKPLIPASNVGESTASSMLPANPWHRFLGGQQAVDCDRENSELSFSTPSSSDMNSRVVDEVHSSPETSSANIAPSIPSHPLSFAEQENSISGSPSSNSLLTDSDATKQLKTNVGKTSGLVQYGCCLTASDIDNLKIFLHELLVRGLVPWVERQLRNLSELVRSRKGNTRRIFTRLFPGNKASPTTSVVYTSDAPEMQIRRLADLAFMFQVYSLAYDTYHSAKRDFQTDQAPLHLAGALEMATFSVFLHTLQSSNEIGRSYPSRYIDGDDGACVLYRDQLRKPHLAVRCGVLHALILRARGLFDISAAQFAQLAGGSSGDRELDIDLRAALLLEQAAICFLRLSAASKAPDGSLSFNGVRFNQYAYSLFMAATRFERSHQRIHALRCYTTAVQFYAHRGWHCIMDQLTLSISHIQEKMLLPHVAATTIQSLHFAQYLPVDRQQLLLDAFVRILDASFKSKIDQDPTLLPCFSVPVIRNKQNITISLLEPSSQPSSANLEIQPDSTFSTWQGLFAALFLHHLGLIPSSSVGLPIGFNIYRDTLGSATDNKRSLDAYIGEPVWVSVELFNPLKIPLTISNVRLQLEVLPGAQAAGPAAPVESQVSTSDAVEFSTIPFVTFQPGESGNILLNFTPRRPGCSIQITGLLMRLHASSVGNTTETGSSLTEKSIEGHVAISLVDRRKADSHKGVLTAFDRRLQVAVRGAAPLLFVTTEGRLSEIAVGQIVSLVITLSNRGQSAIHNLVLGCQGLPVYVTLNLPHASNAQFPGSCTNLDEPYLIDLSTLRIEPNASVQLTLHTYVPMDIISRSTVKDTMSTLTLALVFHYTGPPTASTNKLNTFQYRTFSCNWQFRLRSNLEAAVHVAASSVHPCKILTHWQLQNKVSPARSSPSSIISMQQLFLLSKSHRLEQFNAVGIAGDANSVCFSVAPQQRLHLAAEAVIMHLDRSAIKQSDTHGDNNVACVAEYLFEQTKSTGCWFSSASDWISAAKDASESFLKCICLAELQRLLHSTVAQTISNTPSADAEQFGLLACMVLRSPPDAIASTSKTTSDDIYHLICLPVLQFGADSVSTLSKPKSSMPKKEPISFARRQSVQIDSTPSDGALGNAANIDRLVSCRLEHVGMLTHDFTISAVCLMTVRLQVQNSAVWDIMVVVESTSNESQRKPGADADGGSFCWVSRCQCKQLVRPQQAVSIVLQACFSEPGVYNMQRLRVSCYVCSPGLQASSPLPPPSDSDVDTTSIEVTRKLLIIPSSYVTVVDSRAV